MLKVRYVMENEHKLLKGDFQEWQMQHTPFYTRGIIQGFYPSFEHAHTRAYILEANGNQDMALSILIAGHT